MLDFNVIEITIHLSLWIDNIIIAPFSRKSISDPMNEQPGQIYESIQGISLLLNIHTFQSKSVTFKVNSTNVKQIFS